MYHKSETTQKAQITLQTPPPWWRIRHPLRWQGFDDEWMPPEEQASLRTFFPMPVIGHGIGGKDIPIMACLAKARCWSKR